MIISHCQKIIQSSLKGIIVIMLISLYYLFYFFPRTCRQVFISKNTLTFHSNFRRLFFKSPAKGTHTGMYGKVEFFL